MEVLVNYFIPILTALMAYILGSFKFGREKRWEVKHSAYEAIMKDLWLINVWAASYGVDEETGYPELPSQVDTKAYWKAIESLKKHKLLGELVISPISLRILNSFERDSKRITHSYNEDFEQAKRDDHHKEKNEQTNIQYVQVIIGKDIENLIRECTKQVRDESLKDLYWFRIIYSIRCLLMKKSSSEEDLRPHVDCQGNEISNGDLIEIISRGIVFHAYIDDSLEEQARPARQKDVDNESWFNALDWDTSRLIEKAKT